VDSETGECGEQLLLHSNGDAEKFYRGLKLRGVWVRVGMEATQRRSEPRVCGGRRPTVAMPNIS